MNATGPALCSPLNGVGLVTSKTQPSTFASLGLLNQNPTWNVLIGLGLLWSGSKPKIWSSRIVLMVALNDPWLLASRSDWYHAIPKLVKFGSAVASDRRLLR